MPTKHRSFAALPLPLPLPLLVLAMLACAGTAHPEHAPEAPPQLTLHADHGLHAARAFGHSHNDYEHDTPLSDALDAGSLAIEADVHLVDGRLLVAHDADEVNPANTLESLYLNPLADRFAQLGGPHPASPFNGRVRPSDLPLVLMIDFKTDGDAAWPVLESLLADHPGLFRTVTRAHGTEPVVTEGPVIVAISGNRPDIDTLINAPVRRSAIDGGLFTDLGDAPAHLYPMVSASDDMALKRVGGRWSASNTALRRFLAERAAKAAQEGRLSRIWGAPDNPQSWNLQINAGITLINNDHPAKMEAHLQSHPATSGG